jgi:hypothetical protein
VSHRFGAEIHRFFVDRAIWIRYLQLLSHDLVKPIAVKNGGTIIDADAKEPGGARVVVIRA